LRRLAGNYFRNERPDHTLQPTALVHEAYLRLVNQDGPDIAGRTHFMALGARVMRRVLIDYARGHARQKRGGGRQRVLLESEIEPAEMFPYELAELNEALDRLAKLDSRQAQIVEMRFFGGLSVEEVAETLGLSKRTVEGDWTHAKAWLRTRLDLVGDA